MAPQENQDLTLATTLVIMDQAMGLAVAPILDHTVGQAMGQAVDLVLDQTIGQTIGLRMDRAMGLIMRKMSLATGIAVELTTLATRLALALAMHLVRNLDTVNSSQTIMVVVQSGRAVLTAS